ncbi:MAG: hypothetical protein JWL61_2309 [Gemmatimonadetes bacterium]|nr:hypothetical protein [Gemmatimonadota bacterium]
MKLLRDQWLLISVLALLAVAGVALVAQSQLADIGANLGIELLGTVMSVLFIDLVVTRHIDRREERRRRPILRTIAEQLRVLVDRIRGEFAHLGIDLDRPMSASGDLSTQLNPARFNEKLETAPGHFVSRFIAFTSENSYSRKFLRDFYNLTRADLPPELASAILGIVARDDWSWHPIAMSDTVVDRSWIDERQDFLFEYLAMVKRLDSEVKRLEADVVLG